MYPFWDLVVFPTLAAADARRIVEIGALRGDTTVRLIRDLGEGTQLHVIDPVPDFDPSEHERAFPGQYVFHRALSLDVLDDLPPMDAALIDGDHNWYTVVNELRSLSRVARAAGRRLPVMLLHDVGWPYGRRDLYYDPDNIPPEHRQDHRLAGISRATDELRDTGGFNKTLHNAVPSGGPRNGVMTALEDFIEEYDRPVRLVVLPIYYGLAILVDEETLAEKPALRELLDRLESAEGRNDLLELSEEIRLDAANTEQNFISEYLRRIDVLAERYLTTIKRAIVNELQPEQELRITHLYDAAANGRELSPNFLHDPVRADRNRAEELSARHRSGSAPDALGPLTTMGAVGVDRLHGWLDEIVTEGVRGDFVDCGAGWGGISLLLRAHLEATFTPGRAVWAVDRFSSADPGDLNTVRDTLDRFDLLDDRVRFLTGPVTESVPGSPIERVALLHLGEVAVDEIEPALALLYPKLSIGGRIVVATKGDPERESALDRFAATVGVTMPERPTEGLRSWRKADSVAVADPTPPSVPAATAPLLDDRPATKDLTMVVVFYDMQREAARTLRSLSRSYQVGIDDLDYEVLVVDNGSPEGRGLNRQFVESFGSEFVFHDLADRSTSSPTTALNHGIAHAEGEVIGLMVDGAHVLTPGVIKNAMVGMRGYAPAAVATQVWHLGPGEQSEAMAAGYDEAVEDRLMDVIEWPTDGYKLFDIGHFQAGRDWLEGMWESNCLFVSRDTIRQVGGFDDSFDEAGGGYCNLEIFERVCGAPHVTMVTLIGEASFHQIHGGTTTNQPSPEERFARIQAYAAHYEELRGRPLSGPRKIVHYVGNIRANSRRSKARRMASRQFFRRGRPGDPEGPPLSPIQIPDDLADEYVEAYWASGALDETTWIGHDVWASPDDLVAYQQLVVAERPEWIVVTGTDGPGRALFLASICDLIGHGRVVSVDVSTDGHDPIEHDRIVNLRASAVDDDDLVGALRDLVPERSAMVVIGSGAYRDPVMAAFDALAPFVAIDGHAVVEWTVLNGHPVWPSYGPGPHEALRLIRRAHPEFIEDPTAESRGASFHRGGFLKKVRHP